MTLSVYSTPLENHSSGSNLSLGKTKKPCKNNALQGLLYPRKDYDNLFYPNYILANTLYFKSKQGFVKF
jgi:hypothetical protein